jgi:hypothetical protein
VVSATINFNFYTTSAVLFNTMSLPLEKKVGTQFGPPGNARLIYFVDGKGQDARPCALNMLSCCFATPSLSLEVTL